MINWSPKTIGPRLSVANPSRFSSANCRVHSGFDVGPAEAVGTARPNDRQRPAIMKGSMSANNAPGVWGPGETPRSNAGAADRSS